MLQKLQDIQNKNENYPKMKGLTERRINFRANCPLHRLNLMDAVRFCG